jgi:hypothetical protein
MRVRALSPGFYPDTLRSAGDEFEVPDGTKGSWFEPVDGEVGEVKPKPAAKSAKVKGEPQTFSEIAKKDGEDQKPKGAEDLV